MTHTRLLAFILMLLTAACASNPQTTPPPTQGSTPILQPPTETASPSPTPGKPTRTPPPTPELPDIPEAACIPEDGVRSTGIVTGVVDGDTIDVTIQGLVYRVRYLGVDTPETRDPDAGEERMGKAAAERNLELVKGERVILVGDPNDADRDVYGRLLRYVLVGDIFVNYQLLREGLAFLYFSDIQCGPTFFEAYETAQADKVGLFAPTATP